MADESIRDILADIRGDLKVGANVMETAKSDIKALEKQRSDDRVEQEGRLVVIEASLQTIEKKCDNIIGGDTKAASWAGVKASSATMGAGGLGLAFLYGILNWLSGIIPALKSLPGIGG